MNTASSGWKGSNPVFPTHPTYTRTYTGMHVELSSPSERSNQVQVCVSTRHDTTISVCVCVCECVSRWHKIPGSRSYLTSSGGSETPARGSSQPQTCTRVYVCECVLLPASHWGQDVLAQTRAPSSISYVIEFHAAVPDSKHGPSVCEEEACLMQNGRKFRARCCSFICGASITTHRLSVWARKSHAGVVCWSSAASFQRHPYFFLEWYSPMSDICGVKCFYSPAEPSHMKSFSLLLLFCHLSDGSRFLLLWALTVIYHVQMRL